MIDSDPESYSLTQEQLITVWEKQIDSYNHYQLMAQRFIGILVTGLAILASFSIGAISVLDIKTIFSSTIDFNAISQGIPLNSRTLLLLWFFTPFISMMWVAASATLFYDSLQIHNSVISVGSLEPTLSTTSNSQSGGASNSEESNLADSIWSNSRKLNIMKDKIVAGNNQAKRAISVLLYSITLIFYWIEMNGYNLFFLYALATMAAVYVVWGYDNLRELMDALFPETSDEGKVLIFSFSLVAFGFSTIFSIAWVLDYVGFFFE